MGAHYVNKYSQLVLKPNTVFQGFGYWVFIVGVLLFELESPEECFNFFLSQIQNIFLLKIDFLGSFLDEFFEGFTSIDFFQHCG